MSDHTLFDEAGEGRYNGQAPAVVTDTSAAAAKTITPVRGQLQSRVWEAVHNAGPSGMICEQIEQALNGRHQGVSARVRELAQDTDDRPARLWIVGERVATSGRKQRVYVSDLVGQAHGMERQSPIPSGSVPNRVTRLEQHLAKLEETVLSLVQSS